MKRIGAHMWKSALARFLAAVMILSTALLPSNVTIAAAAPALTQSSRNILEGKTYDLNVKNKIAKSSYSWTSSNKKVATVDKWGIVKGIKKGSAVITCTIKAGNKTYKLTSNITVIKPALAFKIKNKATVLNLGQVYDLNRTLAPSTSNDKTTWTTSDKTVANPDKLGKFTALKEGTVTITGKTLSGKSDSVTIKVIDKEGIVTTQEELDALLGTGVGLITIKTDEEVDLKIGGGKYNTTKLVVDAPKADVVNNGQFKSIEIKQIAANSWYENAVGNLLSILAKDARVVVGANAKVKIEVTAEGAKLVIVNNGVVEEIVVDKPADINISGKSTEEIPLVVNVSNVSITTSVPLNLTVNAKIDLTLLKGAENTKIKAANKNVIPTIHGDIKVTITVGDEEEVDVEPTPLPVTPGGGGGNGGGSNPTPTPTPYSKTFTLPYDIADLDAVTVTYQGQAFTVGSALLDTLANFLNSQAASLELWRTTTDFPPTSFGGQTVTVTGAVGYTKTVSFAGGQLDGRSYTVTVGTNGIVTVTSLQTNATFTVSKGGNNRSLTITGDQARIDDLSFTAQKDGTFYLDQAYTNLALIDVTYGGQTYSIGTGILDKLVLFLSDIPTYQGIWDAIGSYERTYDGVTINISGSGAVKTVAFTGGQLDGKSYEVTVVSADSVTVKSLQSNKTFTITKGADNKTLTIGGLTSELIFAPFYE